jgi:uncharacterized MnhB-related membrane protein
VRQPARRVLAVRLNSTSAAAIGGEFASLFIAVWYALLGAPDVAVTESANRGCQSCFLHAIRRTTDKRYDWNCCESILALVRPVPWRPGSRCWLVEPVTSRTAGMSKCRAAVRVGRAARFSCLIAPTSRGHSQPIRPRLSEAIDRDSPQRRVAAASVGDQLSRLRRSSCRVSIS